MKSQKTNKKLIFNKATIANLNNDEMFKIKAGRFPATAECIDLALRLAK